MSTPLTEQQRAEVRRALRNTPRTASAELVQFVAEFVDDARGAESDSPRWRAAVGVLVEQAGPVLRRLLDAEAEIGRLRAERDQFADRVAELEALPPLYRATWRGSHEAPTTSYQDAWTAAVDACKRGERDAGVVHYGREHTEWVPRGGAE